MLGTLLVVFAVLAISITLLLICLCTVSCMGMLGFITPFLLKIVSVFHDKPYTEEQDPINNQCFICIEKIQNEVVATCNHSFCGECIMRYIQTNPNRSINCPACRKEVLVLFRRFQAKNQEQKRIKTLVSQYNYKYTREPSVTDRIMKFFRAIVEFGTTIRHIPMLMTENGIRFILADPRFKYIILLAIYALSPFDALPEGILGPFGLLDDGIAVAGLLRQVSVLLYSYIREESNRH